MHIPTGPINIRGSALSGALAAEETDSLRRARALRSVASKLTARELDMTPDIATDQETETILSAWGNHADAHNADHPRQLLPDVANHGNAQDAAEPEPAPISDRVVNFWA